jgi:hypothetical protein
MIGRTETCCLASITTLFKTVCVKMDGRMDSMDGEDGWVEEE